MIRAVLFDMDGILYDSEPVYFDIGLRVMRDLGYSGPEDCLYAGIGLTNEETYRIYAGLLDHRVSAAEIGKRIDAYSLSRVPDYRVIMFEDVPEALQTLKDAGIRMACCSSSPMHVIEESLEVLGIRSFFAGIYSGENESRPKPAPDIYLRAAEGLDLEPRECAVYEDSTLGIQAGKQAGMRVYARREERFRMDQSEADRIVSCAADMAVQVIEENKSWKK